MPRPLEQVAALSPDHPDLHYNLANLHLRQGRVLLGMAELEEELANNPRHRPAQEMLQQVQQRLR